ncbi:unnamed protein product [Rhizoctonia solani]|uniref:Uncharacterized protein n=1 Tax=Rhizoctonia solani TaxID=456999 RepID=A0A8H2W808_9AGAM|nr:unnamed protein product [Rhizoctonia solani]
MVKKLCYRLVAKEQYCPGVIQDVFDGAHYRCLQQTILDEATGYHFFDSPHDIPLGVSTNGLSLFKWRQHGQSTAWPIIIINYGLHPSIRVRLENVICIGVIPGPKQCKDLNSFFVPLIEELLKLEAGIWIPMVSPANENNNNPGPGDFYVSHIVLRAFLIILFGDIPAISKLLMMKGHNAAFGLNSRPVFSRLKSIDLANCAPYDTMHLLFENLVPNMIRHWTGNFKGICQGTKGYEIKLEDWEEIGKLTTKAAKTILSAFVGTLPNIAQNSHLYKAEAYAFWFQYIALILLEGRLQDKYYE